MIKLVRTNSDHPHFVHLVKLLDAYLKITDGEDHDFYNQFNNIDVLKHTIIAYVNEKAVGCGAFKEFNQTRVEIKRMFTLTETRGQGIATRILNELETWAAELNYSSCVLETGIRQEEAIKFYKKSNYKIMSNYGQYAGIENSMCFEKEL